MRRTERKKEAHVIRKADIILFCALLLISGILLARPFLKAGRGGDTSRSLEVTVRQDGKVTGTYPLSGNRIINLDNSGRHNVVEIRDGTVMMKESSCKNQICVDEGRISRAGQSIICLPNRIVVEISGRSGSDSAEDNGVDAIAQ